MMIVNAWIEGGVIKCMSQMCNVGEIKCPRFFICKLTHIDIKEENNDSHTSDDEDVVDIFARNNPDNHSWTVSSKKT